MKNAWLPGWMELPTATNYGKHGRDGLCDGCWEEAAVAHDFWESIFVACSGISLLGCAKCNHVTLNFCCLCSLSTGADSRVWTESGSIGLLKPKLCKVCSSGHRTLISYGRASVSSLFGPLYTLRILKFLWVKNVCGCGEHDFMDDSCIKWWRKLMIDWCVAWHCFVHREKVAHVAINLLFRGSMLLSETVMPRTTDPRNLIVSKSQYCSKVWLVWCTEKGLTFESDAAFASIIDPRLQSLQLTLKIWN